MAGGGSHQRPPSSFHIGRLHPGSGAGAGVAAGGVDQLLGANSHPLWTSQTIDESDRELDLLKQAGADVVRIDLSWTSLETAGKGQYSQWYVDKTDEFLQHAKDKGIKVIATLWSTPCWASTAPDDLKQGCTGDWWNRGVDHYPPADPADYGDIAGAVAAHWG